MSLPIYIIRLISLVVDRRNRSRSSDASDDDGIFVFWYYEMDKYYGLNLENEIFYFNKKVFYKNVQNYLQL